MQTCIWSRSNAAAGRGHGQTPRRICISGRSKTPAHHPVRQPYREVLVFPQVHLVLKAPSTDVPIISRDRKPSNARTIRKLDARHDRNGQQARRIRKLDAPFDHARRANGTCVRPGDEAAAATPSPSQPRRRLTRRSRHDPVTVAAPPPATPSRPTPRARNRRLPCRRSARWAREAPADSRAACRSAGFRQGA